MARFTRERAIIRTTLETAGLSNKMVWCPVRLERVINNAKISETADHRYPVAVVFTTNTMVRMIKDVCDDVAFMTELVNTFKRYEDRLKDKERTDLLQQYRVSALVAMGTCDALGYDYEITFDSKTNWGEGGHMILNIFKRA